MLGKTIIHPLGRVLAVTSLLLCAGSAQATTYEVAPTGNDANAGTALAPFKTLQKAANTVAAGDTVFVNDGTYAGFRVRTSGTASARIVFKAKNKWGAKVTSPDPDNDVDLISVLSASYVTIDGFEVTGAPRAGIGVRTLSDETGGDTRDNIVQNCYSHDNGLPSGGAHDGIFAGFALNFTAQNNVCDHNGEHGIYISNSADNPVVRGNVCSNNRACGIQLNADVNTQIDGNADGLISNWLVEGNVIFGNGTSGGSAINLDGDIFGVCRNNLIYNNLATGIALYSIDGAQASHDNLIANNTIYQPNSTRAGIYLADGANNNIAFNNLIYVNQNKAGIEINAISGFQHDYNFVSSISGGAFSAHESSPAASTLFANIAGNDYHLKTGSTAIDAGVATFAGKNAPSNDLEAHTRPQGAGFDLGAYELTQQLAAGVLQLGAQSYSANESAATASITVTRIEGSAGTVSVKYATGGGTATAGADYAATSGTLSWAAGDTSPKTFTIALINDSAVESTETVGIALSTPTGGATIGTPGSATLSIIDNDSATPTPTSTLSPTPRPHTPPQNKSLAPNNVSDAYGVKRTFTATYIDADGISDMSLACLRVGGTAGNSANALLCCYNVATNKLYLRNDANTGWLGGFTPGSAYTIGNAHGILDCSQTTIAKAGTTLSINWNVSAKPAWAGTAQRLFLWIQDKENLIDGYDAFGNWRITGNLAPRNVSILPNSAINTPNTLRAFTTKHSDPNGWQNIAFVLLKIGDNPQSLANSLLCYYDVPTNKLYLRNDANTEWLGGVAPGSATILSNSQGSLDASQTTVGVAGNEIAVRWSLKASSAFVGNHPSSLYVRDGGALHHGYDALGSWQITTAANGPSAGTS